jgi:hypothetical protein
VLFSFVHKKYQQIIIKPGIDKTQTIAYNNRYKLRR